jgi:hypothetical protein
MLLVEVTATLLDVSLIEMLLAAFWTGWPFVQFADVPQLVCVFVA